MATILVVDGNPVERRILRMTLELDGHRLAETSSGAEALDALRRWSFDLVLCAMDLAEGDGYRVVREGRALPGRERTPFVAILEADDERGPVESFLAGAVDLLIRPFGANELREAVARAMEGPDEVRRRLVGRQLEAYEAAARLREQARQE
jgi:CheY-like chemotaxis protein